MKRIVFTLMLAVIVIFYLALPGLAQESSYNYQVDDESTGTFWNMVHALWLFSLFGLFVVLYINRDRRIKVLTPGQNSEKEEQKILSKGQLLFAKLMLAGLAGAMLALAFGQYWMFLAIVVGAIAALYSWSPAVFAEIWKSLAAASKGDVAQHTVVQEKTTFNEVGGLEEVAEELQDVVSMYKNRKEADEWDIRLPRGVLLVGPPGCGKTLLARAVAGEAGLTFLSYSAAGIGNSYVRSGARHIKSIFDDARAKSPCVLFIDEIDSLGRKRGYDSSGEFDHALTEFLYEMDGLQKKSGVLVLAATNREDILDEALLRPGRFDKKILVPQPDANGRENILKIHTAKKRFSQDVNLRDLAERTPGFTGAALEQLTNEAAQLARRHFGEAKKKRGTLEAMMNAAKELLVEPKPEITKAEFEEAILRVQMGPARKTIMSEKERRIVAYHEMGHAVVTAKEDLEILDKVMLMPRNWALGMTLSRGEETHLPSKAMILAKIASLLGGRAAEEVFLGKDFVTTGAGNDFEKAAELARRMVCEWGMGEAGAAIFCQIDAVHPWQKSFSEHVAKKIDTEVETIISTSQEKAKRIIIQQKSLVEKLSAMLLEKTILDAREIMEVLKRNNGETNG